ncbi:MAG TPA: ATP-binding protein [Candidatus Sabulitectum sp.]|nr:ATP-binding protein [Candidatus Sabulitectum sp.]
MEKHGLCEYPGLSEIAEGLLGSQESTTLDFKESVGGLSSDDLVAFANSEHGGTILLGVREKKDNRGMQAAEIIGCEVGDKAKLSILGKAASCVPPVEVRVIVENSEGKKPFLRVEIPQGQARPCCTSGGTYKIRGDARNDPLTPERLLEMFMEAENDRFIQRFSRATEDLESSILDVKKRLLQEMEEIYARVDGLNENLGKQSREQL